MKLSKYFQNQRAALESEELEAQARAEAQSQAELVTDVREGDLSDTALAIDAARDEAADHSVQVVQSIADARDICDDASELRQVEHETEVVRDAVVQVNEMGGFSAESYAMAKFAMGVVLDRVGVVAPGFNHSLEDFAEDAHIQIGLEGLDEVLTVISGARSDVEAKSVDALLRVIDALKDAIPEVKGRLESLKQSLAHVTYDEEVSIRLDEVTFKALAVDGRLPVGFKNYFEGYKTFAACILGPYSENAMEAASKAPLMGEALVNLADTASPIDTLAATVKEIGDPRTGIDADELCFILPGSGALFGNKMDLVAEEEEVVVDPAAVAAAQGPGGEAAPELVQEQDPLAAAAIESGDEDDQAAAIEDLIGRLEAFSSTHAPLDPLAWSDRAEAPADIQEIRVLSKDTIEAVLCELICALELVDIKTFADSRQQTWMLSRTAFSSFQRSLLTLAPSKVAGVRQVVPSVGEYLDTLFTLSAWPALHLLANMVFTANGFLLLAERSISGKSEEAPVAPTPEETATPEELDEMGSVPASEPMGDDAEGGNVDPDAPVDGPAAVLPSDGATSAGEVAPATQEEVPPTEGGEPTEGDELTNGGEPTGEEPVAVEETPEGGEETPPEPAPTEETPPAEGGEVPPEEEEEEEEEEPETPAV